METVLPTYHTEQAGKLQANEGVFRNICHKVYALSVLALVTTEKSQIISQLTKPHKKECAAIIIHNPVPGGYKYGDLSFQVGGVSDETAKYGREFCRTSTYE
jgi:hypothetical protein